MQPSAPFDCRPKLKRSRAHLIKAGLNRKAAARELCMFMLPEVRRLQAPGPAQGSRAGADSSSRSEHRPIVWGGEAVVADLD